MEKVLQTIEKYKMFKKGDRVAVACSGGEDSMSLLHYLWNNKESLGIDVCVVNVDHSIREHSAYDSHFVSSYCIKNNIKIYSFKVNAKQFSIDKKLTLEQGARECRYRIFRNLINIDYYQDVFASCGTGSIVFSEDKIKLPISTLLIEGFAKQKTYSMINATGNSMAPTIDNGDKLIVEHWTGAQIQDNKIYVFCFNNEFFVKRLSKNLDEIIIKSDNPEYRTRTINGSTSDELILVGKIVGVIKSLR